MGREIRFRVWHNTFGMMPVGGYDWEEDGNNNENLNTLSNRVLMQSTGLKDRSGQEIYEGDIVRRTRYDFAGKVSGHKTFAVEWRIAKNGVGFNIGAGDNDINRLDIIGNIYETPGLLE